MPGTLKFFSRFKQQISCDLFWDSVTLACPFSTSLDDVKSHVVAPVNGAALSTDISVWGAKSLFLNGSNQYLAIPYSASDFDWWTGDYTLDLWSYVLTPKQAQFGQALQVVHGNPATDSCYWAFGTNNQGKICFYYWNGTPNLIQGSTPLINNRWHHLQMTHKEGKIYLFSNGSLETTVSVSGTPLSGSDLFSIGALNNARYHGYIQDLRITKGARNTMSFSVPTQPMPTKSCS